MDYRGLAALDAVVGLGGFERAAAALAISQPAVSHRLRALEDSAGELLVIRSQPPQATARGQRLIAHYRQVQLLEAALQPAPDHNGELPRLAIAVNADSAATWLPGALAPLLTPPRCLVELRLDDQDQTLRQLREGRVVACVSTATEAVAGTSMTPLGAMRYHCVAAPAFARTWLPDGLTAAAVARAPALVFNGSDTLHARFLRQQGLPATFPSHSFPSSEGFVRFIEAGHGYGMVPWLQAGAALQAGTLVDVAPGAFIDVALVWHRWNIQTELTRALSEHVIAAAARVLR
jgi:LysR family transcriptional regulator (chromosome initiation inhibitor)